MIILHIYLSTSQKQWGYMATCKQVHMFAYHSYQTGTLLEIQEAPDLVPEQRALYFL